MIPLKRLGLILAYRLLTVWWFVRRPAVRGAMVLVHDGRCMLVVRTSYRRGYTLPGGAVGRREMPRAAALRELREETGLVADASALEELATVEGREAWRRTRTVVFGWQPQGLPQPRPDGAEIVWAGYRRPAALHDKPLTPGLAWAVDRLGAQAASGSTPARRTRSSRK